ncbi:MAG: T9SS type A sorting domain-containing protein [Chitinophagales bacterium]
MKRFFSALAFCCYLMASAQNNYYSLQILQQPYHALTVGTAVNGLAGSSGDVFRIPLHGQNFSLFGSNHLMNDTTTYIGISADGFLDIEDPQNIVALNGLRGRLDSIDASSQISYSTEISGTGSILKVEWEHFKFRNGPADNELSFQIWMYRNTGSIEYHFGPSTGNFDGYNSSNGPKTGLIFAKNDLTTVYEKIWLTGDSSSFQADSSHSVSLPGLYGVPAPGTVFRFEHVVQPAAVDALWNGDIRIFPVPATNMIYWSDSKKVPGRVQIFDQTGKLIADRRLKENAEGIDVSDLKKGTYFLQIEHEDCRWLQQFVKG